MNPVTAIIEYSNNGKTSRTRGTKMLFSPYLLFRFDDSKEETECIRKVAEYLQALNGDIALAGPMKMVNYILKHAPELRSKLRCTVETGRDSTRFGHLPVVSMKDVPTDVAAVLICETRAHRRQMIARNLGALVPTVDLSVIEQLCWRSIPKRAWIEDSGSIYPMRIPEVKLPPGLDMVLMDLPSRNLSMMPNGLGYVHKALKKSSLNFTTIDCDIILYHRFHTHRLLDLGGPVTLANGKVLPDDPWSAEDMSLWDGDCMAEYFADDLKEIVDALIQARPRILGLSIQQCNLRFSREVVQRVKNRVEDMVVIVGGYSCRHEDVGLRVFPECDYMAIGEADESIVHLVEQIKAGKRPRNIPGIISANDDPTRAFLPASVPEDIDALGMPDYDWFALDVYRNHHHYQLTPVIASRGCHWGRCRFCGEALPWRTRSPREFVDEIEYMVDQGCYQFVFSESDLNGDPVLFQEICREISSRDLPIILGGQLRIDKRNTPEFFRLLRRAGFVSLRFGVDGWSTKLLKIQNKGYNVETIRRNIKDCHNAGIYVEVNAVVGCPGETDEDVEDSIELMLDLHKYIGRLANINPLQLLRGSVFWNDPQRYNIRFVEPREKLMAMHLYSLPPDVWYSEEPFIDHHVRNARCAHILASLQRAKYDFGAGASTKLEKTANQDCSSPLGDQILDGKAPMIDRLIRIDGEYYLMPSDGTPVGTAPGRLTCWRRMVNAIRRPERYGNYATRIFRRVLASARTSLQPTNITCQPRRTIRQGLCDDTGSWLVSHIARELPPNLTTLVKEYEGYNILRVKSTFCAIRHGYPLDIDKVFDGGYSPGVCITGDNLKQIVAGIRDHSLQHA